MKNYLDLYKKLSDKTEKQICKELGFNSLSGKERFISDAFFAWLSNENQKDKQKRIGS